MYSTYKAETLSVCKLPLTLVDSHIMALYNWSRQRSINMKKYHQSYYKSACLSKYRNKNLTALFIVQIIIDCLAKWNSPKEKHWTVLRKPYTGLWPKKMNIRSPTTCAVWPTTTKGFVAPTIATWLHRCEVKLNRQNSSVAVFFTAPPYKNMEFWIQAQGFVQIYRN